MTFQVLLFSALKKQHHKIVHSNFVCTVIYLLGIFSSLERIGLKRLVLVQFFWKMRQSKARNFREVIYNYKVPLIHSFRNALE